MKFDAELAERICREMGIEYHPEQDGVTIGGEKLSDDFSTEKLFEAFEYHENITNEIMQEISRIGLVNPVSYEDLRSFIAKYNAEEMLLNHALK